MTDALETADTPADDATEQAQAPDDRARNMGWRPLEEFKGDKDKWVDAETFLRRGEEVLPLVRAENKQLEKALRASEAKLEKLSGTIDELKEFYSKTEKRAYERAKAELEQKLEDAADAGDTAGVKRVNAEIVSLEKDAAKTAKEAEPAKPPEPVELTQWKADNPWFDTDRAMTLEAVEYSKELGNKGVPIDKQWAMITAHIKTEFPHKFENQRRNAAPAVEGEGSSRGSRGKSYSDLPPDARAQCDRFVKQGVLTREAYLKDYAW